MKEMCVKRTTYASLVVFDSPPLDILNVIEANIRGVCLDRLCLGLSVLA